jgi:hypothetical protein
MSIEPDGGAASNPPRTSSAEKESLFWALAERLLDEPLVSRSTMMGFPCLRLDGRFFASIDRNSNDLVVKLTAERVDALVSSGLGKVFAPNHRVFRQWVAIPTPHPDLWAGLMEEAKAFSTQSGPSAK